MPATTFDFTDDYRIEQGVYRAQVFVWKSNGTPINLTGYSARMQMRASVASETILLELTTTNGGIVLGGSAGTVTVVFKDTDTVGVDWKSGVYDLELVNTSNQPMRFLEGTFELSKEVTR